MCVVVLVCPWTFSSPTVLAAVHHSPERRRQKKLIHRIRRDVALQFVPVDDFFFIVRHLAQPNRT
jgi:hypothetical protein